MGVLVAGRGARERRGRRLEVEVNSHLGAAPDCPNGVEIDDDDVK